ncbi:Gfo/Idh/MocA family protein [Xenorhabdus entomophaga]|uniref:Gfo/Idh/MocA family protein n=1 Tax=Xenorhabdus entomophaga TaxID=3136257 RepID=UPI0030F47100
MSKFKIGVLSTARIVELGIILPANLMNIELYSVAARDPEKAKKFAKQHNFTRYHNTYQQLIDDPKIDIIYNPLPNGLHGPWNIKAIKSGKHVLTEKPFSSNESEARSICEIARSTNSFLMEGFHYSFHPVWIRINELLNIDVIGKLKKINIVMIMPEAPVNDPRWSLELAGGALMDLGCYAMHIFNRLKSFGGGGPQIYKCRTHERLKNSGVDEKADVIVNYPNGLMGTVHCDMGGDRIEFTIEFIGEKGRVFAFNFLHPHMDDRILIETNQTTVIEKLGKTYSYTHQLQSFLDYLQHSVSPIPLDESLETMKLIDICYRFAKMEPRPTVVM